MKRRRAQNDFQSSCEYLMDTWPLRVGFRTSRGYTRIAIDYEQKGFTRAWGIFGISDAAYSSYQTTRITFFKARKVSLDRLNLPAAAVQPKNVLWNLSMIYYYINLQY